MTKTPFLFLSVLGLGILSVACGAKDDEGETGNAGSGGVAPDTGGAPGTGSVPPAGGTTGGAGVQTTGGASGMPTGGIPGSGGIATGGIATGGIPGSGGIATGGIATGGVGLAGTGGEGLTGTGGEGLAGTGGEGLAGTGGEGTGGEETGGTGGNPEPEPTLITSGPTAYWQEGEVTVGGGSPNVTVNENDVLQDWYGFGGTFNEAGWHAMQSLSQEDRDRAIRLLFDIRDGCGFTYGRIPIGSSDYGLSRYSLNETPNDYEMTNFSIDRDLENLIPYIKAALAVKPDIRFWASPWSPPTWMKDNNAFDRGNMKNDPQTLGAHALYLARFVEEYALQGINIEAVHPQNEPGYLQDYPSCGWSAGQFRDYIANYAGPLFADRLPGVAVWVGTMSNGSSAGIVTEVMGDDVARGYVGGIGLQWAMGDGNNPSQYAQQYGVHIMQTEHKCGNFPGGGARDPAPNDHAYAVESWGYFKNWIGKSVNSYMAWNMVLDTHGLNLDAVRPWNQNALLAVDVDTGELIVTPTYYLFRHFAQYVEPGAVRVGTQGGDALAFRNPDGSIVTVLYNSGGQTDMTVSVGGQNLQFSIPGQSWATVNWQG